MQVLCSLMLVEKPSAFCIVAVCEKVTLVTGYSWQYWLGVDKFMMRV
jgi:hypothetical protein